jgi:hypothetical protein
LVPSFCARARARAGSVEDDNSFLFFPSPPFADAGKPGRKELVQALPFADAGKPGRKELTHAASSIAAE